MSKQGKTRSTWQVAWFSTETSAPGGGAPPRHGEGEAGADPDAAVGGLEGAGALRAGERAEVVVEGVFLLDDDDDVLDGKAAVRVRAGPAVVAAGVSTVAPGARAARAVRAGVGGQPS